MSYGHRRQCHGYAKTGTAGSDSCEALDLAVVADMKNFNERKPSWEAAHRRQLPIQKDCFFASSPHRQLLAIDTIIEHTQRVSIRYKNSMSINTTVQAAMSSSDSVPDQYLSVIGHTFSNFGSIFASLGLWVVHGLALALCFFGLLLAMFILFLPIKFIAERIFENVSATAPSNERPSSQYQQQDLEANLDASEDVRTAIVERVPDNTTQEQAQLISNESSHATEIAMASRAPNDLTDEQVPPADISHPGPSNAAAADDERATHSSDGEILDVPSSSADSDKGSDYELEERDAHSEWPETGKPVSVWTSVR